MNERNLAMEGKRIKLDKEWLEVPQEIDTFGLLMEWVCLQMKNKDRVFLGALHGEVTICQDELAAWRERPISEFDSLEFLSAESRELAFQTCSDLIDLIEKLNRRAEQAAKEFDEGDKEMAAVGFNQCLEGWAMVLQGYWSVVQIVGADPAFIEVGGRSLSHVLTDLGELTEKAGGDYGKGYLNPLKTLVSKELSFYAEPMQEAIEKLQAKLEEAVA
jgi:hypothetical protein